ncbi:MAG: hypothetical protein R3C05_06710 [Pirellulaceae bacterium]
MSLYRSLNDGLKLELLAIARGLAGAESDQNTGRCYQMVGRNSNDDEVNE